MSQIKKVVFPKPKEGWHIYISRTNDTRFLIGKDLANKFFSVEHPVFALILYSIFSWNVCWLFVNSQGYTQEGGFSGRPPSVFNVTQKEKKRNALIFSVWSSQLLCASKVVARKSSTRQESPQRDSNLCDADAVLYQLSYLANRELVVMWVSDTSVFKLSDRFYANSDHLTPKMACRNVNLKQQSFPGLQ